MKTDSQLQQDVTAELQLEPSIHAARIGVSCQETEWHVSVRLSVAVNVLCVESYNLDAGYTGELCCHAVTAEGNCPDRGRSAQNCNFA